jgi:hypothetical protein
VLAFPNGERVLLLMRVVPPLHPCATDPGVIARLDGAVARTGFNWSKLIRQAGEACGFWAFATLASKQLRKVANIHMSYGRGVIWPHDVQVRCASLSKKRA